MNVITTTAIYSTLWGQQVFGELSEYGTCFWVPNDLPFTDLPLINTDTKVLPQRRFTMSFESCHDDTETMNNCKTSYIEKINIYKHIYSLISKKFHFEIMLQN